METKTQLDDTGAVCSPGKSPDRGVTLGTVAAFGPGFELRGRFPSGQRGQTVNLMATPSPVRIRLSPPVGRFSSAISARHGARAHAARTSLPAFLGDPGRNPVAARVPQGGRSSMVERQPSKLIAWVRFPSPAPDPHPFISASRGPRRLTLTRCCSSVVEHFLGKEEAMGSSPISSSTGPARFPHPIQVRTRSFVSNPSKGIRVLRWQKKSSSGPNRTSTSGPSGTSITARAR